MQRLRIRFRRGQEIKFISHLDIMRLWQRALARAGISLAYSEGFNPHPRMSLAAPLALGVTSETELMDIVLANWVSPHSFEATVSRQLPGGVEIMQVYQMALNIPSLQSQVRFAEYSIELETEKGKRDVESAISSLLSLENLAWQHQRDTGPRRYDLRTLIDNLWLIDYRDGYCTIGMNLRCDSNGSGRPEQVAAALGFDHHPQSIHRTKLILKTG
ncbi:TIGR03936 family radical SAM-associated protein [Chloroflexota bacterium]